MAIFALKFSLKTKYSSSIRGFASTNQDGDNLRRALCLAANSINLENFQISAQDITRISLYIYFSVKSSTYASVFLGFSKQPLRSQNLTWKRKRSVRSKILLFLLLMDRDLAKVMQAMTLEEDEPVVLTDDEDYSAAIRNGKSLIGRLLNPECQNMAKMLRTMPKIWKIYERVRGIALSKESFQFVFDLETDLQTVLKHGFWTFEDWGVVMERWVEFPPEDYLQKASVWIRLLKIPVNYLTLKTITAIAYPIGYIKDIEFDPSKPHLFDYVRVRVILDLQQPVRDIKTINLAKGGSFTVEVEYERVKKKCFHCFRLSHEKQRCPLFKAMKNKGGANMDKGKGVEISPVIHRKHHTDLVDTLMPLMSQSVPPGFVPRSVVAPEVFTEMQLYMNCTDPEERRIREFRMKEVLKVLSSNPGAQSSYLRLETHPRISAVQNKDLGQVFDFRSMETETERLQTAGNLVALTPQTEGRAIIPAITQRVADVVDGNKATHTTNVIPERTTPTDRQQGHIEGGGDYQPLNPDVAFCMGQDTRAASDVSGRSSSSTRKGTSWKRLKQSKNGAGTTGRAEHLHEQHEVDSSVKRKSREETEVALDRAFGNSEWFRLFPRTHTYYLERLGSDHRPILTNVIGNSTKRVGRFVFDKRWSKKPEMVEIVRRGWNELNTSASPSVTERIASCRKAIAKWKRNDASNSRKMIEKHRVELEEEEKKINPNMPRMIFLKLELANEIFHRAFYLFPAVGCIRAPSRFLSSSDCSNEH
ncbi:hypothetical protein Rs2_18612 [Raphanus sativus]|nr:hypothetical protein Rs2_18612 [Raphanus sativus]